MTFKLADPRRQEFSMDKVAIEPETGCWLWQRRIAATGYATIGQRYMHREVYELHHGPIAEGLHIDHLCRVRHCVNPEHLEAVTQAENNRRQWVGWTPATECLRGHDLTDPSNLYFRKDGSSRCRACVLLLGKRRREKAA